MPGHGGIYHYLQNAPNAISRDVAHAEAHDQFVCPHCGDSVVGAVIAATRQDAGLVGVQWIRCPSCHQGVVKNTGMLAPSAPAGEAVDGLPPDVAAAYAEARNCAGVRAYTACELICRKILMHVAVDKGDAAGKSFAQYIDYLENSGYTTPTMKPWVDLIRTHGNVSTHEIPPADSGRAMGTLAFTAQLLKLVYEMDFKVKQFMSPPSSTGTP